jgi:sulfur-carrier protein
MPSSERASAATITLEVPSMLRGACRGEARFSLRAASVGEAVKQIEQRYPDLYRSICDETGAVRRHVNLFVNSNHVRRQGGFDTPLAAGDVLFIFPAVSGG